MSFNGKFFSNGGGGGGSVDLGPLMSRLSALETGPLMVGVGESGARDRPLYLETGASEDKALMTKDSTGTERPV